MKNATKVLTGIVKFITCVSAITGTVAFVKERVDERNKSTPIKHKMCFYEHYLKRTFDATLSTGAILVLSPILGITALLVRIKLGSPVLFIQERPGKDEKIFKLYKFRTMTDEHDLKTGELLNDEERLTEFGKKLRSTSLDELPELLNIIKGDMAVVGPRPLLTRYLPRYNVVQHRRHEVRPGLTGLAQIHGRNTVTWADKFDWDVKYLNHITFLQDCKIILNTIKKVFNREGIRSETSVTMEEFMGNTDTKSTISEVDG